MKRKVIALIAFISALAFILTACSGAHQNGNDTESFVPIASSEKPEGPGAQTEGSEATEDAATAAPAYDSPELTDYSSAYAFYVDVLSPAITRAVEGYLTAMNASLDAKHGGDGSEDPAYYNDFFAPFVMENMGFTSDFSDSAAEDAIVEKYESFGYEEVKYYNERPGGYRVEYTDESEDGSVNQHIDVCAFYRGSIRFEGRINGKPSELFEYIALGSGCYAIQTLTMRALVNFKNGRVEELLLSQTRHDIDPATGRPAAWSIINDPSFESIMGGTVDREWVLEKADSLMRIFEIEPNGRFTYSGYCARGTGDNVTFEPFDPVVIDG